MRHLLSLFAALCCMIFTSGECLAQKKQGGSEYYNYQKAQELVNGGNDYDKALGLLSKQLAGTPDHVESLFLRARIFMKRENYADALMDLNHALKVNRPKRSGLLNSVLMDWKASVYSRVGEDQLACDTYAAVMEMAKKDNKGHLRDAQWNYAQALCFLEQYDKADEVYRAILAEDESDVPSMAGLASNMIERGQYREAVELLEKASKYDENYSEPYHFLTMAYDRLGETDKAIDNAMLWLEKDPDALGDSLYTLCQKHEGYAVAKIKEKMKTGENKMLFAIVLPMVYKDACKYEKAVEAFDNLEREFGKQETIYLNRADCYFELGLYDLALAEIDKALEICCDAFNLGMKGTLYRTAGRYEEAIACYDRYIEEAPVRAYGYYAKGWCYELMGDEAKALEAYDLGIDLDKTHPYIFLMRGDMLLRHGEKEKAAADYEKVLQLDTLADDSSCRMYALQRLGRDEEAQQWMDKVIESCPAEAGPWYDQACLYARMGKCDEAVKALRTALEKGYCQFAHIAHDDDMDPVRNRKDFKALIAEYSARHKQRTAAFRKAKGEERKPVISEIAITRHAGGTFEVPCSVNGLQLNMIFDTGASDVTISKVEADFMFKNNYLSEDDIKGKRLYQIANGELSEGTVITLREVKVGDAVLHNVEASVVKSQKAPLLLGQSVMEKFGTFTVDNINSRLLIKH